MPTVFINKLNRYLQSVPIVFKSIGPIILSEKPNPEKWSKKETMGHLIDSALANLQRFTTILFSPQPLILVPYQQDELVKVNDYQNQSAAALTTLWKALNQQILTVWKNYSEEDLKLLVRNPSQDTSGTLSWWIQDYTEHLEHHLQQIFDDLSDLEKFPNRQTSVAAATAALERTGDQRFVELLQHGSMLVEYYAPDKVDLQQPHRQDELYIVQSGSGIFYNDGVRTPFVAGDVLFVPAGLEHRFEDFTEDFATWVVFYGPDGGELPHLPILEKTKKIEDRTFSISTDPKRLDLSVIHQYLTHSYWGTGRTIKTVEQSIFHSFNFGLYSEDRQIGFARVITDFTIFAYLADVFILEEERGKGLGKWLLKTIMEAEIFDPNIKWTLHTKDAHRLYEQVGFSLTTQSEKIMERNSKR